METYVQVAFWMNIAALVINLVIINNATFPIRKTETLGNKLFAVMVTAGFTLWGGFLLYA